MLLGLAEMRADPEQALPEMVKLVSDEDGFVRDVLARSLSRMGSGAVPTLTTLLDDREAKVRGHAAKSLGALGPAAKEAVPALKRRLDDMRELPTGDIGKRVCHYAGEALVKILGDNRYLEGLPPRPIDGK